MGKWLVYLSLVSVLSVLILKNVISFFKIRFLLFFVCMSMYIIMSVCRYLCIIIIMTILYIIFMYNYIM